MFKYFLLAGELRNTFATIELNCCKSAALFCNCRKSTPPFCGEIRHKLFIPEYVGGNSLADFIDCRRHWDVLLWTTNTGKYKFKYFIYFPNLLKTPLKYFFPELSPGIVFGLFLRYRLKTVYSTLSRSLWTFYTIFVFWIEPVLWTLMKLLCWTQT